MPSGSDDSLDPREEAEKRREAASKLITLKGGVELFRKFPRHEERRYEELVDLLSISRATVSSRLDEAEQAGLLDSRWVSGDNSPNKLYELTKTGKQLQTEAQNRSFARIKHKIEALEEELEDEKDDLDSWVQEHLISVHPPDRDRDPHP